jgi:S1-C subfamily serine protease
LYRYTVPPSADFQLTEFDLPGPERRKLATPQYRRQRKKMNSFVREAAERVGPCVVRIDVDFGGGGGGGGGGSLDQSLLPRGGGGGGGGGGGRRSHGQGCGLVFDGEAGLVITNAHVVDGKGRVKVTFTDGRVYAGTVMGSDALTDIALVRIEPRPDHKLPRAPPVGDSATLEVGRGTSSMQLAHSARKRLASTLEPAM